MRRLQGGLELVAADALQIGRASHRRRADTPAQRDRAVQQGFGLTDQGAVPQRRVLQLERHEFALVIAPRHPARIEIEHQSQQTQRLGFVRQQGDDQTPEPDGFFGQRAPLRLGAQRVGPAIAVDRVDRRQHRLQALGQLVVLGHLKRDAGLADAQLAAHQALAHGRWRHTKGRGDGGGVKTQHGLQHQRRAQIGGNAGVRAGEHQAQAVIGDGLGAAGAKAIHSGRIKPRLGQG